jgi:hypothetical protein
MFIKNQTFKDEETLMEMLFDFSLGDATEYMNALIATVNKDMEADTAYVTYRDTITDEEEKLELIEDERLARLTTFLLNNFDSFEVSDAKLYAVKGDVKQQLYVVDLY